MEMVRLWLSALTTPVIAAFGVWIALQQYRLQKYRLRHDLSERRFAIFVATREFIRTAIASPRTTDEALTDFDLATAGASFLFQPDVLDYLASLRASYCKLLAGGDVQRMQDRPDDPEVRDILREAREQRQWMRGQLQHAERVFHRYLDLSTA